MVRLTNCLFILLGAGLGLAWRVRMSTPSRFSWLLIGAFAALYLIWGSTYLAVRIGIQSWPPLLLGGVRFVLAGALMYAFLRGRGAAAPSAAQWRGSLLVGLLLISCGNGGISLAMQLGVASGVAALATATVPLFTLLFGLFWGQRQSALEWAGIALGLFGIGLLNFGGNLQSSPLGALLILLSAAAWAFGSIWGRSQPQPSGAMASATQMLCGGVALLLGGLLSGERLEQMPSTAGWLALLYLALFGSIIAFSAYLFLLKHVRPAAATSYAYVNPLVAMLLGILFAGEQIDANEWLALLIILSAVLLIGLRRPGKA